MTDRNSRESVGERIINRIVEGKLVDISCPDHPECSCLAVWSANAAEQITETVARYLTEPD